MSPLVLGVDGGNTKTVALVAETDGGIIGAGRGGCADIYGPPGFEAGIGEISGAVRGAVPSGRSLDEVEVAVFSLAGADWDEDKQELLERLSPLVPRARVTVENDALGALRAGTDDGIGVSVVAGTGGCVGSRGHDGRVWHSSWWGLHLGAWSIGNDALDAVYEAELGLAVPTALTEAALSAFAAATVEDVLHEFTRRGGRTDWDAALFAPAVMRLAAAGDVAALGIVERHATRMGDLAAIAASRVGLEGAFPLVILGGLMRGAGATLFVDRVCARVPTAVRVQPDREPAVGALLLALDVAGGGFDPQRVDATAPPAAFFATHLAR